MAWDSVPWFVGGGAEHSPEVARLLAYAATNGAEGLVSTGDLKVRELSTPGSSVRVAPGAALILNRASGGDLQTYVARMKTEETIAIAATGSGSGRSDLVVARIEDPWLAGEPWQDPVNPKVGPYVFTRVISNVPSGTTKVTDLGLGYSAIPLARIDLPASTSTITSGMITDLRKLANPREHRELLVSSISSTVTANASSWTDWNAYVPSVYVPEWATYMNIVTTVAGALIWSANTDGNIRNGLGSTFGTSQVVDFDNPSGPTRETLTVQTSTTISSSMRGTTQNLRLQAYFSRGSLEANPGTQIIHDIQFSEKAV